MNKFSDRAIKVLPKNEKGIDYAVGDIHGCFNKLYEILKSIGFDETKDRLICVGDLCDRGPNSIDVLDFLDKPYVYTVFGNHEQILLLYENKDIDDKDLIGVGASWWLTVPREKKDKILERYKKLPLIIEVQTDYGKIGILHAEYPLADWNNKAQIFDGFNSNKFLNKLLWGSSAPSNEYIVKNVDAIIVGHMTQNEYKVAGNLHLIDTGAVYKDGYFTILNLNTLEPVHYFK